MVRTTEPLAGAITLMVFAISLLTYNSGPGLCAGAAVAHSASATTLEARAAIRYLPPDAMSVVEDRLVSIEGLVEPPDAVPAPESTQDGPREVRAGDVGVVEVDSGQVGTREIDLAQVRAREVGAGEVGARHVGAHHPHRLVPRIGAQVGVRQRGTHELGVGHDGDD